MVGRVDLMVVLVRYTGKHANIRYEHSDEIAKFNDQDLKFLPKITKLSVAG